MGGNGVLHVSRTVGGSFLHVKRCAGRVHVLFLHGGQHAIKPVEELRETCLIK